MAGLSLSVVANGIAHLVAPHILVPFFFDELVTANVGYFIWRCAYWTVFLTVAFWQPWRRK